MALAAVALLTASLTLAALTTTYETQGLTFITGDGSRVPKSWTRACWREDQRAREWYTRECVRVRARVLYRQREDPDGDGDKHLVAIAGPRLVEIKYRRSQRAQLPGLGSHVTAIGTLGDGRLGMALVEVSRSRGGVPRFHQTGR